MLSLLTITHYAGKTNTENLTNANDLNSKPEFKLERLISNNFEFSLDINDTIFVLTKNNSRFKENVGNVVSKMIIINNLKHVNLDNLSEMLGGIGIKELNIFSIYKLNFNNIVKYVTSNNNSNIKYLDIDYVSFIKFLNSEYNNFLDYNKNSLYIVRGGNYIDIKNLFASVNNCQINLGRWRIAKSSCIESDWLQTILLHDGYVQFRL